MLARVVGRVFSNQRFYRLLEVEEGASEVEIKAAYLRLVKQYHPDSTNLPNKKEAAEKFHLLTEARDTLLSSLPEPPSLKATKVQWDTLKWMRTAQSPRPQGKPSEDRGSHRRRELLKVLSVVSVAVLAWLFLSLRAIAMRKRYVEIDVPFEVREEAGETVMRLQCEGKHVEYEQVSERKDVWRCRSCDVVLQRHYLPQHCRQT